MIRFSYTDNHIYTCRDCERTEMCNTYKHSKQKNRLVCAKSVLRPRMQRLINSAWDYMQLKRQLVSMRCIIETTKNGILTDGLLAESLKSNIIKEDYSFTEYCAYGVALKSYYRFLIDNEEYGDNDEFMSNMILTFVALEDDGSITVTTENEKAKDWIKKDVVEAGYTYREKTDDVLPTVG